MSDSLRELMPKSLSNKIFLLCLYLAPLLALLWLVSQLSVNVPFGDQPGWLDFFEQVHNGTAKFKDFFTQHNEHRMLVPRAILVKLAFATGWNIHAEIYLSIFISVITFIALFWISLKGYLAGAFRQPASFHTANLLTCCFTFSWIQQQNWLWGFQVPWFLINTFLVLAVLVLYSPSHSPGLSPEKRLGVAAIFCYLASFSSAHGLFTWIALTPSVIALGKTRRKNIKHLSLWGFLFFTCLAVYLVGYYRPPGAGNYYARSIGDFLGFFFVSLGFPLLGDNNSGHLFRLISLGVLVLGAFASIFLYGARHLRASLFLRLSPWLSLGTYACVFAFVNGYARSGNGIGQALKSRYTTPGILICIALIQLLPILCHYLGVQVTRKRLIAFIAVALIFQINSFVLAIEEARYGEHSSVERLKQPACIELLYYLEDSGFDYCFGDNENMTRDRVIQLNRIGLRESFEEVAFVDRLENLAGAYPASSSLSIDSGTSQTNIAGEIYLPHKMPLSQRPAAVVLALDDQKTFIALTHLTTRRLSRRLSERLSGRSESSERQDKLTWRMEFSNEDFSKLVADARYLNVYLYYRADKQFALLATEEVSR